MCLLQNVFLVLALLLALAADLSLGSSPADSIVKKKHRAELICKEICQEPALLQHSEQVVQAIQRVLKFKSYDPMSEKCICVNFRGGTISKKLYKASNGNKTLKKDSSSPKDPAEKEKTDRRGRQVTLETISDTGEQIITDPKQGFGSPLGPEGPLVIPGLDVPPLDDMMASVDAAMGMRPHGHRGGMGGHGSQHHHHRHRPSGHGQYGDGHYGGHRPQQCTPMSCSNKCPHDCDSLCRYNGECYCSCPEDMTYEYYDNGPSFLGSIFG